MDHFLCSMNQPSLSEARQKLNQNLKQAPTVSSGPVFPSKTHKAALIKIPQGPRDPCGKAQNAIITP